MFGSKYRISLCITRILFFPQKFGQKCVLYTAKYGKFLPSSDSSDVYSRGGDRLRVTLFFLEKVIKNQLILENTKTYATYD